MAVWREGSLQPRTALLRVYAVADGEGHWRVLPGGLTRVAGEEQVVTIAGGGSSVDTWVLTRGPVETFSMLPGPLSAAMLESARRPVTSRAAENLFWMGCYAERAEFGVRLARATLALLGEDADVPLPLLDTVARLGMGHGLVPAGVPLPSQSLAVFERTLIAGLLDEVDGRSVAFSVASLARAGEQVRERLSAEHVRLIGQTLVEPSGGPFVGALPGIGASLGIGILLPFMLGMKPVYAIALTMSINVGNSFGNSIPAILMGVPGGASAVLTAMDGYVLHKQGKSGLALGVTYFASCFGQFVSIFFFLAMVVPLSGLAYVFLAPEMTALYFLGMCAIISITGDNILKGIAAGTFGLAIALIGRDPVSGVTRFAYHPELRPGVDIIPVIMGLLAMSELFRSLARAFSGKSSPGEN